MRELDGRGLLVLTLTVALSIGAITSLEAGEVVFDESCFPTCEETDGRFLILAGGEALDTLTDEALRLKFSVDKNALLPGNRFAFEIFDGDVRGADGAGRRHWDISPVPAVEVTYKLFAIETLLDGTQVETLVPDAKIFPSAGPSVNPLSSTQMFDNAWFVVEVEVGAEAEVAGSGNYLYSLEIERDLGYVFPPDAGLLNAFKVRTNGSVFLSLLEQPFAFEAKWASGLYDIPIIYPGFNPSDPFNPANLEETTYPGSFTFNLNVGAPAPGVTRTSLTIYDGDLDHGNSQGGDRDTDDADIAYPVPCVFGLPGCPLPFQIGAGARSEGVAFSVTFPLATGSPPDDLIGGLGLFNRRAPSVEYRIDFPVNTDPGTVQCRAGESVEGPTVDGRRSILNLNPSGNREWESFVLSTDPFDPSVMDCHVDTIPSGVYRVELVGMDMNNLNAWFFGEDVCGSEPDGTPFCPFGEYLVGDTVWEDTDGDGNGDPAEIAADGEPGFQGVIVRLVDGDGRELGRTLTDANGQYEFAVSPGEYTVEVLPENFASMGAAGAVGDRVWLDADRGGDQDVGEPGIPGVRVELWSAGGDGVVGGTDDLLLDSAVTDLDGRYLFTGLPPGDYYTLVVDETVPDGLALTGGTDPSAVRTIVADDVFLDLDFGYGSADPALAVVGDRVWHDLNSNGVQDPGEPGIDGVTVQLLDGVGNPVTTVVTEGGFYLFTGLAPGTYEVDVTDNYGALAGYTLTTANDPTGTFSVAAGQAILDKDFGYFRAGLYSVSDFVWYDADRDGVFDGDETGLEGVTVSLVGSDGITMATTTTAVGGAFSFAGLPDGSYALVIGDAAGVLNGLLPTTRGALDGSTGFTIAGANASGINFGYVAGGALAGTGATTPSPSQTDEVVDDNVLTYDFGYRFGTVGDRVWLDLNNNGAQDAGEPGINGVTVNLIDAGGNVIDSRVTSGDGNYTFTRVAGGTYTVAVDPASLPAGLGQTFDLDGVGTPDQATFPLAAAQDRDDVDFGYIVICGLTVEKACQILPEPGSFSCSDAKPLDVLTMIWGGSLTVDVLAWKGNVGSTPLPPVVGVGMNDEVSISGFAGSPNDVYWEIFNSATGQKIGESKFHLSCSDGNMNGPEDCGLYQGDGKSDDAGFVNDWRLEGLSGNGVTLDCNPVPPPPAELCEAVAEPVPSCDTTGDPDFLTWRYTGGGCAASDNDQEPGKAICTESSPGIDGDDQVTITGDDGTVLTVQKNEEFVLSRSASKEILLTQPGGVSEFNVIHVSCSQPLQATDVYGSLSLVALDGQRAGTQVLYTYDVFNSGASLVNVILTDDPLGAVGTIPSLPIGGAETLTLPAALLETTVNTVYATGVSAFGTECTATDQATVILTEPCDVCKGGTVELTLEYQGASAAMVVVYDDKDAKPNEILFQGLVQPGGEIPFTKRAGQDKMDSNISVWVGGVRNAIIHTSCSQPIGPGQVAGDFLIVEARSRDNGLICDLDTCNVDGSAGLEFNGSEIKWEVTNAGDLPVYITRVVISWPSENGDLVELKRDGDTYHKGDFVPTSADITSGWEGDEGKRKIKVGETDTLKFKFDNHAVLGDYAIRVEFDQGCSIETSFTGPASGGDFACNKPIDVLSMIWNGVESDIEVTAWKGPVGSTKLTDREPVSAGGELSVAGFAGSPNDVVWELFDAAGGAKIGESVFHLSCSDDDMDGPEDCGKAEGDGKGSSGYRNDWVLEGMVDAQTTLDCTGP